MGAESFDSKLERITDIICATKEKNEEKFNKASIYDDVLKGYQMICAIVKDSEVSNPGKTIAEILETMSGEILAGNIPTKFESRAAELAPSVVEKNIETEQYIKNTTKIFGTMAAVTVGVGLIAEIPVTEHLTEMKAILDTTFTPEMKNRINDRLVEAKRGDEKAIGTLATIKNAAVFFASHHILDEKSERGALAWMMNLSQIDTPEARRVLNQMAKRYKMDVFKETPDGKQAVSRNKLIMMYREKIGAYNPKMAEKTDFSDVIGRRTQIAVNRKTFEQEKNADTFVNGIESIAKKNIVRKKIDYALVIGDYEKLEKVKQADSESFKDILDEKINAYNYLSIKSVDSDKIKEILGAIEMLSKVGKEQQIDVQSAQKTEKLEEIKELDGADEMEL